MKQIDWKNKKIALLGFGSENQAVFSWLIKYGANDIVICDKDDNLFGSRDKFSIFNFQFPNNFQFSKNKFPNVKINYQLGSKYLENLQQFDVIFRTPGIPYLTPEIQNVLRQDSEQAKKAGVEISSQMKLFFDLCPAKIIGVTGTKGKGTTVSLITTILAKSKALSAKRHSKAQKPRVFTGGNIGNPPIEFLDKLTKNDWVVLELSSFQLQDLEKSPHIAVVLDIKEDHLDHHKNRKEYVQAKENIVKWQGKKDYTIINLDYLTSFRFAQLSPTQNDYYFSRRKSVDLGCFVEWESKGQGAHFGKIILRTSKKDYEICKTYDITLRGEHNLENICAAITASYLAGASIKFIQEITPKFKGLEHRLEYVTQINSVKFYNDSFSTTPDTTIAAIKSFNEPIILIVGGSDKGANYSQLAKEIAKSTVKAIIAIGITGPRITDHVTLRSYSGQAYNIKHVTKKIKIINNCKNIWEIVKAAFKEAELGDVVLLSPASASFDMFANYKDRGEQFKLAIANLKN